MIQSPTISEGFSLLMLVMSVADPKTIATVTLVGLNHHHFITFFGVL